jgi:hypothetical protein
MALLSGINAQAFSFESWFGAGFEYGNFFEKKQEAGSTIESYIGSPGIDMSSFQLWDNFGYFISLSFLFPNNIVMDDDACSFFFQFAYVLGPAFKFDINEKISIKTGFGFSSQLMRGEYDHNSLMNINLGIGGDAGISYMVNHLINISMGAIVNYQFASLTSMDTAAGETKKWAKNYSMTGLRPYIRIGFVFR